MIVQLIKKEWHQVTREFSYEINFDVLEKIYPESSEEELQQIMSDLESGELSVDTLISDAMSADIYFDWEFIDDDWWTDRKGGYDVTYEILG